MAFGRVPSRKIALPHRVCNTTEGRRQVLLQTRHNAPADRHHHRLPGGGVGRNAYGRHTPQRSSSGPGRRALPSAAHLFLPLALCVSPKHFQLFVLLYINKSLFPNTKPSLSSGLSDAPWLNRRRPGSLYSIIEYDKSSSPSLSSGLSDAPWLNRRRPGSLYSIIEYE